MSCLSHLEYENKYASELANFNANEGSASAGFDTAQSDKALAELAQRNKTMGNAPNPLVSISTQNLITIKLIILLVVNLILAMRAGKLVDGQHYPLSFEDLFTKMITPDNTIFVLYITTMLVIIQNEFNIIDWRGMYLFLYYPYLLFIILIVFYNWIVEGSSPAVQATFNATASFKIFLFFLVGLSFIYVVRDIIIMAFSLKNKLMVDYATDLPPTVSYRTKQREFLDTGINIIMIIYLLYGFITMMSWFGRF